MQTKTRIDLRWLVCLIGVTVLGIEVTLWAKLPFDVFRFCVLCSIVLVFLLWRRRDSLSLESGPVATAAGLLLVALVLFKTIAPAGTVFASVSPLLSGLGLALLASGFKGLRQYWREFGILVFLLFPFLLRLLLSGLLGLELSPATAVAAVCLARLFGWQVSAHGVIVQTPGGIVAVYEGCSGIRSMFFIFGLTILLLMLFPPRERWARLAALPAGILIAFVVNAFRVTLLIILVSESRHESFEYWHIGSGALLFESASVFAFILLYRFLLMNEKPDAPPAPSHAAVG